MSALRAFARAVGGPPAAPAAKPPDVEAGIGFQRVEYTPEGEIKQLFSEATGIVYQFIRTIRQALMGKVKLAAICVQGSDGSYFVPAETTYVAIKKLRKDCVERGVTVDGTRVKENPLDEVAILHYLAEPGHDNVMRLYEFLQDEEYYYIVLEFLAGGELFDQLQLMDGRIPEAVVRRYMYHAIRGTRYLHERGIAHRDLSLENCMLDSAEAAVVKIIDFGLAVLMPERGVLLEWDGAVGKSKYMPLEIRSGQNYDAGVADVWCLGIMMFVLLTRVYPYTVAGPECRYFRAIQSGRLLELLGAWGYAEHLSAHALDILNRLLQVDPATRISITAAEEHPWFDAERELEAAARGNT